MVKHTLLQDKKNIVILLLVVLLLAIGGWSVYSYMQTKKQISQLSTLQGQQMLAKQQVSDLLTKVEKHMVLPKNETPTVATVTDVNALKKNQPFFEGAKNGDQVLVYVGAKKAIIYSPSRDIIVNVGFVAVDNNGAQANTNQKVITVDVRNGTSTAGLGQKVATAIKNAGGTVQKVTDAKNKEYTQTVVVDTGKLSDKTNINALAQLLNAQVVTAVPEGEATSTADAIVFVGSGQSSQ